jgi:hypothetical protein
VSRASAWRRLRTSSELDPKSSIGQDLLAVEAAE